MATQRALRAGQDVRPFGVPAELPGASAGGRGTSLFLFAFTFAYLLISFSCGRLN